MLTDLRITEHDLGRDASLLELEGQVDLYSAPAFKERMLGAIERGKTHLVVDLTKVDFMDSTGLSVLVGSWKRVRPAEGSVTIVSERDEIRRLFELVGLERAFAILSSRDEAIELATRVHAA
jgi:anti-sigma B factor antagonist